MTLTRKETIERLKQNKAAAEYYAGQSQITAEIENALKDSEAFDMAIEALQTDADRPHGEWYQIKDHKIMGEGYLWHCSICDYKVYQDSSKDYPTENFCPNCGSRMEK